MGLDTFVAVHSNHAITLGFTNECVVLEFKKHNTPLVFTLNLNMIKFWPNLATFAFVINPSYAQHHKLHGSRFDIIVMQNLLFIGSYGINTESFIYLYC
jgi:hypothetical protein